MRAELREIGEILRPATAAVSDVARVRCVLRHRHRYLLVTHKSWSKRKALNWALPGGRLKGRELPEAALRRELNEELYLALPALVELGDWRHRGEIHRLYGCDVARAIHAFDTDEIADVAWLTHDDLRDLARANRLHRGYELAAIDEYVRRSRR